MSGRLPCHEYVTCRFGDGALGFEIVRLDPDFDPILGNAIISKVVPLGQAERERVNVYDAVVTVNGEYVAFLNFETITSKLRYAPRPLTVMFARPWRSAWDRIGRDVDGAVKIGFMEKFSSGTLYSRWQQREFLLSRTTLSYSDEGVLRKKIALEEIVQLMPSGQENEFQFMHNGREYKLRCNNAEDAMLWLHAIETTKKGCFDNADKVLSKLNSLSIGSTTAQSQTAAAMPTNLAPKKTAPPVPPISRGPYYLLNKSQVIIKTPGGLADLELSLPPPIVLPPFQPIDLSVEKQVLGS